MTYDECVDHLIVWGRWCRSGELAPWLWETDEPQSFKLDRYEIDKAWRVQRAVMRLEPLEMRLILQVHYVAYKNMTAPTLYQEVNLRLWRAGLRERQISGRQYPYFKEAAVHSLRRILAENRAPVRAR